jgi:single-stranded-DNA-specific exonuclease
MQNRPPLFVARALTVVKADAIGFEGKHLRLSVCQDEGKAHKCIAFSFGEWATELAAGDRIDAVFELTINEWNGNRELQLKIADLTRTA